MPGSDRVWLEIAQMALFLASGKRRNSIDGLLNTELSLLKMSQVM